MFETYERCVKRHILPTLGGKRLHALTPTDIRTLLAGKLNKGLAPSTVQYIRAVLRSALAQAMRDGLVHRNVAALVRPPWAPRQEVKPLRFEEARTLLTAAIPDRLYALWVVALSLGLRRSELLGLAWSGVDLETGTIRVDRGVQRIGGALVLDELKSARSHRTLPLSKLTAEALPGTEHGRRRSGSGPGRNGQQTTWCSALSSARRSTRGT